MSRVFSAISMSLDGFVTGPDPTPDNQLGDGGDVLFRWLSDPAPEDTALLDGMRAEAGAVLMGRIGYDLAGWQDGGPVGKVPCFVVTHRAPDPETVRAKDVFTFVTDGLQSAVARAKAVAGPDRIVGVHGASLVPQLLDAGLLDVHQIHLVPVLLGRGTRLFEHLGRQVRLERDSVVTTPTTTHLRFRVLTSTGDHP